MIYLFIYLFLDGLLKMLQSRNNIKRLSALISSSCFFFPSPSVVFEVIGVIGVIRLLKPAFWHFFFFQDCKIRAQYFANCFMIASTKEPILKPLSIYWMRLRRCYVELCRSTRTRRTTVDSP